METSADNNSTYAKYLYDNHQCNRKEPKFETTHNKQVQVLIHHEWLMSNPYQTLFLSIEK